MPIEFQCSNCGKLLRTPDTSAGKRAKCPQCTTIIEVPHPPDPTPAAPAEFDFTGLGKGGSSSRNAGPPSPTFNPFAEAPHAEPNPYASPAYTPGGYSQAPYQDPNSPGLPWEIGPKSFGTFWETVTLIFQKPSLAFSRMRPTGGFENPLLFALAGGLPGALFNGFYVACFQAILLSNAPKKAGINGGAIATIFGIQFGSGLVGGIIGTLIGIFIAGAINHVCLMIVGGAKKPFDTTVRVIAFQFGAISLLQLIPGLGMLITPLASLIYTILGLSTAHRISVGKAALAVFLPILVCCGGGLLMAFTLVGLGVMSR